MKEDLAKKAASLIERIEELEKTIFKLEELKAGTNFKITSVVKAKQIQVEFPTGKLSSEIFQQNILNYTIDNFNIELKELKQELDDL